MSVPASALAELTEISSQVEAAVLFDRDGAVEGATVADERAGRMATTALALLEAAEQIRAQEVTQIEAATGDGNLFVVRDGARLIAAATSQDPTAGLVFYDLKSCLRRTAEKPKPKPRRRTKAKGDGSS
jgi:predicted regulator of Ras-like GTPase activity (Roadblock/LC7/MglB family)